MKNHIVSAFDDDLRAIAADINRMGSLAHTQAVSAIEVLVGGKVEQARAVIAADKEIDAIQHQLEEKAVLTIARNQPMAIDLREIIASLRVANDLERVGDLAKNIAKRTIAIEDQAQAPKLMAGFTQLANLVLDQINEVVEAYKDRDDERAMKVWRRDGEVDALHTAVFRELLTYMMEDARNITICTHLLFCAKNIERIGDHATNIAETLHFVLTGEIITDDRPKLDKSSQETISV